MKRWLSVLLCAAAAVPALAHAQAEFRFGVIAMPAQNGGLSELQSGLQKANAARLEFVVVNGIKAAAEACSDEVYEERAALLEENRHPVIASLSAADWTACANAQQQPVALERLARLRELLYPDNASLGSERLPLLRQASSAKFAAYAENARWNVGNILFATLSLPANNNNYLRDAGRNSEHEDRVIATRDWLQRIFSHAARQKNAAIVLFTDADPFGPPERPDGYADLRRLLPVLASAFKGKVLLVHGQPAAEAAPAIRWQKNLGILAAGQNGKAVREYLEVTVRPAAADPFRVGQDAARRRKR